MLTRSMRRMATAVTEMNVVQHPERGLFIWKTEKGEAFTEYTRTPDGGMNILHLEVPPAMRGKGVGGAFATRVLDMAMETGKPITISCSFVRKVASETERFKSLVQPPRL